MKQSTRMSLGIMALTYGIATSSNAALIINEIDYDQPGADTAEFIELYNSSSVSISLENYTVDLFNGANSSRYRSIDLSGFTINSNGYFVLCGDPSQVINCNYSFTTSSSWFQNGAPDAIGLYDGESNLLDSLSYEGTFLPFTEGDLFSIHDSSTEITSLSRILNGVDTNNNALDFKQGCITPGSANIAGTGDCSAVTVSTVPIPAAAWLFGSGLLMLTRLARRV